MTALGEQQVEVELGGEAFVELDARVIEARALRRLVVRAQDRRVAARGARTDVALLEDGPPLDSELAEVVGGCKTVRTCPDDDHVVGVAQLAARPPHPPWAEDLTHRRSPAPALARRPALRRGPRRRPRPRATGTRPAPSPPARAGDPAPRRARSRACVRPSLGERPRAASAAGARRSHRNGRAVPVRSVLSAIARPGRR